MNHEYVRLDRYLVHWYTEPATGKCELTSAKFSAMMSWPMTTMGQLQKKKPPAREMPRMNSVKMPVDGEMYEKATAKLE